MKSAMVLSGTRDGAALEKLLLHAGVDAVSFESDVQLALAHARTDDPALILFNPAHIDTAASAVVRRLARETCAGVILFAHEHELSHAEVCAQQAGAFVVAKPVSAPLLAQSVQHALAVHVRLSALQAENARLSEKILELTLTGRAKLALMQYLNMTEDEAHRHIEKQAMDRRTSKLEVAKSILKNYSS